ncbi:MAG TPA: hypothetical protein VFI96_08135, partial [Longimicrobiaceae bacterium]|nr:hypothetical protein [Longimicrobiaceae bacterium]
MPTLSLAPTERSGARASLLVEGLGWKQLRGEPQPLPHGGVTYELSPLAHRAGVHALHCEAPPAAGFPAYAERLRLRRRVERLHADALIVFTDAAHSVEVWSWRQAGQPGASLREESRRPESLDARLLWRLAELSAALAGRGREAPPGEAANAVLNALLQRVRRLAPPALARVVAAGEGADAHARLRALVEGAGDPVA